MFTFKQYIEIERWVNGKWFYFPKEYLYTLTRDELDLVVVEDEVHIYDGVPFVKIWIDLTIWRREHDLVLRSAAKELADKMNALIAKGDIEGMVKLKEEYERKGKV